MQQRAAETAKSGVARGRTLASRWVAAAVVAGLILRLGFSFAYWTGKPLSQDEREYLLLAGSLATGQGLTYPPPAEGDAPRHFERPPIFAFLLAGLVRLSGQTVLHEARSGLRPPTSSDVPVLIKLSQTLIGGLSILLIAAVARLAAGPRAAAVAAWLAALYPPLVWVSGYVLNEGLYSLLALSVCWLLMRAAEEDAHRTRLVLAAGIVGGIALLTKEAVMFFLVLAGAWFMLSRQFRLVLALAFGTFVVLGPWIARNYVVHGRFVLTAAHGGVTFWTGNNPLARGEGDMAANPELRRASTALEDRHPGLTVQQMDSVYYRDAIDFIRGDPIGWLGLEARKVFFTFVPIGPSYRLHSGRYFYGSVLLYALLAPCAVLGIIALARRPRRPWMVWLLAGSAVLSNLVFFPQERFRIPVIDPTLIVCAAAWVVSLGATSWTGAPPSAPEEGIAHA